MRRREGLSSEESRRLEYNRSPKLLLGALETDTLHIEALRQYIENRASELDYASASSAIFGLVYKGFVTLFSLGYFGLYREWQPGWHKDSKIANASKAIAFFERRSQGEVGFWGDTNGVLGDLYQNADEHKRAEMHQLRSHW